MLRPLAVVALASGLVAQQFAPSEARTPSEIPAGRWSVLALADCDGDGDQDVAANDPSANQFVLLRQGPGHAWTSLGLFPGIVTAAAWADVDGDGDLDLLAGGSGTQAPAPYGILRNDGATFPWLLPSSGALFGSILRFAIGDVDGDQRPDVVIGVTSGVQVVRNLGNATFGAAMVVANVNQARPALFDRDGDGDLDLAIASNSGITLFDNVAGTFVPSSSVLPAGVSGSDVAAKDFDGDGRTDLAIGNGGTVDLLWNQPTGWLLAAAVVPAGDPVREVLCGDLDRDGDADLVVRMPMAADWLRNDGNRAFSRLPALRHGSPWTLSALALGDAAVRGACDVVGAFGDGQVRALYGASPEPFPDPQALPAPVGRTTNNYGRLVVGDIDGDGRLDMISPIEREVLHDDGRGRFSRRPIAGARTGYQEGWLVDLDGDGDLDLLLGTSTTPQPPWVPLQRFVNDGLGRFTPVQDVAMPGFHSGFQFGDLDGDGDVDMLSPTSFGRVRWFQNTGGGALVDIGTVASLPGGTVANALVFEDLDRDGDRDLVGTQVGSTLPVYFNDGRGVFTAVGALQLSPGLFAHDVRAADLDGDGALDIAVIESGSPVWYRNDGIGGFTRRPGGFPTVRASWFEFADIDEDGDLDVELGGDPNRLFRNDGTGTFTAADALLWSTSFGLSRFADVDEDGDVDLMIASNVGGWLRALDRTRGAESMQVVRAGGGMQVRFCVQPQAPVPGALVIALAAVGPGAASSIPGIRGRMLLPAGFVVLGVLDASTGSVTSGFAVPAMAGLIGVPLSMQGLVAGPGVTLGFTNVVDERILP